MGEARHHSHRPRRQPPTPIRRPYGVTDLRDVQIQLAQHQQHLTHRLPPPRGGGGGGPPPPPPPPPPPVRLPPVVGGGELPPLPRRPPLLRPLQVEPCGLQIERRDQRRPVGHI